VRSTAIEGIEGPVPKLVLISKWDNIDTDGLAFIRSILADAANSRQGRQICAVIYGRRHKVGPSSDRQLCSITRRPAARWRHGQPLPAKPFAEGMGVRRISEAIVDAVLSGAGVRRRPGINEAHLDDIEEARCARKPAACLVAGSWLASRSWFSASPPVWSSAVHF
jgi:hypothetical protein